MRNYHPEEANAKALRMSAMVEVGDNVSELDANMSIENVANDQIKS
jgi:hypothetical protein